MVDVLDIYEQPVFDDSITRCDLRTYNPLINSFAPSDEVRIQINSQDLYTLVCESYLYIEGELVRAAPPTPPTTTDVNFTNNCFAFLFDEIRYELNGIEIDRCKNVGLTTLLKAYVSCSPAEAATFETAGFRIAKAPNITKTKFNAILPLKLILGFAEDYKKLIINARQELILIMARSTLNCVKGNRVATVKVTKIQWRIPHVHVNMERQYQLTKALERDKPITIAFRKWEMYELPSLKYNTMDVWPIKTSPNLAKPRYVIVVFQTAKRNESDADASALDHVNLRNLKLYLNSNTYPYDNLDLNFDNSHYAQAYQMYCEFQTSFLNRKSQPALTYEEFAKNPIFVIDASNQSDNDKNSTVDVQLHIEARTPFPANTIASCLIISDCVIEYSPFSNRVSKFI